MSHPQALKDGKRQTAGKVHPRKPSSAERKAEARRKARRNRLLNIGIPSSVVSVIVIVAVAMSLGGGGAPSATRSVIAGGAPRAELLPRGASIPSFSAPSLFGGRVAWADYPGAPTVLAVWAPWCPHCQKELPVLSRMAKDFPNVQLVSVVTAVGQQPGPTPRQFMESEGLTFPVAMDDTSGSIFSALGVSGFPTVYWVDSTGKVVASTVGELSESQMRQAFAGMSTTAR